MIKNVLSLSVVLIFVLGFVSISFAEPAALDAFNAHYPGKSYGCSLCHTASPPSLNPYGAALKSQGALPVTDGRLIAVEPLDSDGDGFSNIKEINASTLPGDSTSFPPTLPSFEVTKPASGESVPTGAPYAVTWAAASGAASYKVKLSIDGGATWPTTLGTGLSTTTSSWNVPTTITKNVTNAMVKVIAYNNNNIKLGVAKSGTFTINVLTVTAPAAGAPVPQNAPYTITWTANGTSATPDKAVVKYTFDNGVTWKTALGDQPANLVASSFSWNVPAVKKPKNAKVKVVLKNNGQTVANAVSKKFTVQ
jgi:hypothetical protein